MLLISLLERNKKGNSLPQKGDEILVEDFAEYFFSKIDIRKHLENYPIYDVHRKVNISLEEFKAVSDSDVRSLPRRSTGKMCELDPFPMKLKRAMERIPIPLYMHS